MNTKVSEHENKIPDTSGLATTTVLFTKIAEVEDKIPDVRRFRLEIVKHQAFDSSYFHGKSFFGDDGYQKIFVYQPTLNMLPSKNWLLVGNQKVYSHLNLKFSDYMVLSYLT